MNTHVGKSSFGSAFTVSSTSTLSGRICSGNGAGASVETILIFDRPVAKALPLMQITQSTNNNVNAYFKRYVNAIDSIAPIDGALGLYSIKYTPTLSGSYDINVMINNQDVSTDLTAGITITPALEYAPASTHNISQVAVEGKREFFSLQFRDRFGNLLQGSIDSSSDIMVTMTGKRHACQTDADNNTDISIPVKLLDREPYTDGNYLFSFDPTDAGSYTTSIKLRTRGGLLATYFKKIDTTDPVLASLSNFHDPSFLNPYWCDGLNAPNVSSLWQFNTKFCDKTIADCGCDSTKLDTAMSFTWGVGTPLPYDEPTSGRFPIDFFSVRWEGYITAPGTGSYTFTVTSDYGLMVSINGVKKVSAKPMPTAFDDLLH